MVALWHLQRVLAKKRDPFTHVCFLDLLLDAEEEAAAAPAGDGDSDGEFPAMTAGFNLTGTRVRVCQHLRVAPCRSTIPPPPLTKNHYT